MPADSGRNAIVSTPRPAYVRVQSREGGGVSSWGSGTIVEAQGRKAWVLTAEHILRDMANKPIVHVHGEGRYLADVMGRDSTWDLAVLEIVDPGVTPVLMEDLRLKVGDEVKHGGFGADGIFKWQTGRVRKFVSPGRNTNAFEIAEMGGTGRSGDSGGPIIFRNRLVGSRWGSDLQATYGCVFPRLRRFVERLIPPWRNRQRVETRTEVPGKQVPAARDATSGEPPKCSKHSEPIHGVALCGEYTRRALQLIEDDWPDSNAKPLVPVVRDNKERLDALVPVVAQHTDQLSLLIAKTNENSHRLDAINATLVEIGETVVGVAEFDPNTLSDEQIAALARRLPPIVFEKVNMETQETVRDSVHLGEGYRFRLFPPK